MKARRANTLLFIPVYNSITLVLFLAKPGFFHSAFLSQGHQRVQLKKRRFQRESLGLAREELMHFPGCQALSHSSTHSRRMPSKGQASCQVLGVSHELSSWKSCSHEILSPLRTGQNRSTPLAWQPPPLVMHSSGQIDQKLLN